IVDARQPRTQQQLVAEELLPQPVHVAPLRVEAVAAHVEMETLVVLGPRDSADEGVALEDQRLHAATHELDARGQTGGTGTDDHETRRLFRRGFAHRHGPARASSTGRVTLDVRVESPCRTSPPMKPAPL